MTARWGARAAVYTTVALTLAMMTAGCGDEEEAGALPDVTAPDDTQTPGEDTTSEGDTSAGEDVTEDVAEDTGGDNGPMPDGEEPEVEMPALVTTTYTVRDFLTEKGLPEMAIEPQGGIGKGATTDADGEATVEVAAEGPFHLVGTLELSRQPLVRARGHWKLDADLDGGEP